MTIYFCLNTMKFSQGIKRKNKLILHLMEQLVYPNPAAYRDVLIRFSQLNHTNYSEVIFEYELDEVISIFTLFSNLPWLSDYFFFL